MDSKSDKGITFGYSKTSKAYKVYNSRTSKVAESIHVKFYENELDNKMSKLDEAFAYMHISKRKTKEAYREASFDPQVPHHPILHHPKGI